VSEDFLHWQRPIANTEEEETQRSSFVVPLGGPTYLSHTVEGNRDHGETEQTGASTGAATAAPVLKTIALPTGGVAWSLEYLPCLLWWYVATAPICTRLSPSSRHPRSETERTTADFPRPSPVREFFWAILGQNIGPPIRLFGPWAKIPLLQEQFWDMYGPFLITLPTVPGGDRWESPEFRSVTWFPYSGR